MVLDEAMFRLVFNCFRPPVWWFSTSLSTSIHLILPASLIVSAFHNRSWRFTMAHPIRTRLLTIGLDAVCLFVPFQPSHIAGYLSPLCAALGALFFFSQVFLLLFLRCYPTQFSILQFPARSTRSAFSFNLLSNFVQLPIFLSFFHITSANRQNVPHFRHVAPLWPPHSFR